jgi:hypothetical protein
VKRAGVECTGSYGAALTRHLRQAGVAVAEVNQPDKATRRRRGKTDAIDAEAAARATLSGQARAVPKTGEGHAEAIRAFKMARDSAVKSAPGSGAGVPRLCPETTTARAPLVAVHRRVWQARDGEASASGCSHFG